MAHDRTHPAQSSSFVDTNRRVRWIVPLLMLLLVTLSGFAITEGWDGHNSWRFTLIALIAGLCSTGLAKSRLLDGFAIVFAMIAGICTVWAVTALFGGHLEGGFLNQLREYPKPVINALFRDEITGANRELTADTLLSLTIWMSSWIAMWMLLRVGYVLIAILAPAVLILASQHFASDNSSLIIVAMVGISLFIIVGQRFVSRQSSWRAYRVPVADTLMSKVLVTGLAISVAVSSTILASPEAWSQSVIQPLVEQTVDRFESARLEAQYWFDDLLGTETAPQSAGRYTDFSDGFQIGGPLTLTDAPEVLVRADSVTAPYLKARSYDHYTGRGWTSSSVGDFAEDSESSRRPQELRYNPGWEVALSENARNQREAITVSISPLTPDMGTVLSVDSFLSADMQTVVRMGWNPVTDLPLTVSVNTLNQLPPDVQKLGSLLLQSELSSEETSWGPSATSGTLQDAIETEVDDLARRGVEVRWTASPEGIVQTIFVTGRLPVFDDVEAVFRYRQADLIDPDYQTTGLTSIASPEQLAAAGTDYPAWVTGRYLQNGDTVTDRTLQLTNDIIGTETNPYQQSVLIEQWLRNNIVYDEAVDAPPGEQDLVDYVLFDYQYGYCEHYSAAMTVMLRSLGIPARVSVGYSPGEWDEDTGAYIYRQNNAHAWVEVYFPGYGWVPFEPTANRPLGQFDLQPGNSDLNLEQVEPVQEFPTEAPLPTADVATPDLSQDNSQATPQPTAEDENLQPPVLIDANESSAPPRWVLATAGVALIGAVVAASIWLLWTWSLRDLSPATGLMRRIQRIGTWLGIRSGPTTTPREYARKFESSSSGISVPVKRITRAYEIETFGPRAARDQILTDAKRAWREIKRNWFRLLRRR